jgi:hypothetical protein
MEKLLNRRCTRMNEDGRGMESECLYITPFPPEDYLLKSWKLLLTPVVAELNLQYQSNSVLGLTDKLGDYFVSNVQTDNCVR